MNGKSAIMLFLAVISGLGAMYGTTQMLTKDRKPEVVEKQDVLVAVRDLKAEEVLRPDMVRSVSMRKDAVPAGSFASVKEVADRCLQIPILSGEPILDGKLAAKGTPAGLVSRIPTGMRAFAIEVNEQTGVSGFILPGHRVDVILSVSNGQPGDAEVILQNVLVLASGQVFTRPEDKSILSRTVTVALSPSQVETLVTARGKGPLTLALRGVNDNEMVALKRPQRPAPAPTALAQLTPPPPVAPPAPVAEAPAPQRPRRYLTIFHGMQGVERFPLHQADTVSAPDPRPGLDGNGGK